MVRAAEKYETLLETLYRAELDEFVAVRKRLAAELAAQGDKAGAASLSKATRPPLSAWVVNRLWWQERKAFDELFSTAERLRDGDADVDATQAHRDAITALRNRAAKLLTAAGKAAGEATLRRVTSTLTALAATGSFDPDSPGALKGDRDPPGFEVAGLMGFRRATRKADQSESEDKAAEKAAAASKRQAKAEAAAEERRVERERAQERAERERLERKLRIAREALDARREDVTRAKDALSEAERSVEQARDVVRELEKELDRG